MRVLLDLCEVDMSAIPLMEASKIGLSLADFQDRCKGLSIAVVSRDPLTSVLTRAAEFRETVEQVDVWFAITRAEAREWLELQIAVGEDETDADRLARRLTLRAWEPPAPPPSGCRGPLQAELPTSPVRVGLPLRGDALEPMSTDSASSVASSLSGITTYRTGVPSTECCGAESLAMDSTRPSCSSGRTTTTTSSAGKSARASRTAMPTSASPAMASAVSPGSFSAARSATRSA